MDHFVETVVRTVWCSTSLSILGLSVTAAILLYTVLDSGMTVNMIVDPEQQSDEVPVSYLISLSGPAFKVMLLSRQGEESARKSKIWKTESVSDCMKFLYEDCRTLYHVLPRGARVSSK